jgi:hypothetical protein
MSVTELNQFLQLHYKGKFSFEFSDDLSDGTPVSPRFISIVTIKLLNEESLVYSSGESFPSKKAAKEKCAAIALLEVK